MEKEWEVITWLLNEGYLVTQRGLLRYLCKITWLLKESGDMDIQREWLLGYLKKITWLLKKVVIWLLTEGYLVTQERMDIWLFSYREENDTC